MFHSAWRNLRPEGFHAKTAYAPGDCALYLVSLLLVRPICRREYDLGAGRFRESIRQFLPRSVIIADNQIDTTTEHFKLFRIASCDKSVDHCGDIYGLRLPNSYYLFSSNYNRTGLNAPASGRGQYIFFTGDRLGSSVRADYLK